MGTKEVISVFAEIAADRESERNSARYQIERAVAMLDAAIEREWGTHVNIEDEPLMTELGAIRGALMRWIESEGGPWYQRG